MGATLYGDNYKIVAFPIRDAMVEVAAAREGFYAEWPRSCKYFVGRLGEVRRVLVSKPMKTAWKSSEGWVVEPNERALPEIIFRSKEDVAKALYVDSAETVFSGG